ncbi:MAG: hypothetical protein AVDCRST_MAG10-3008, partial [uncultured Acidimicrobiales bacterium]
EGVLDAGAASGGRRPGTGSGGRGVHLRRF